MLIVCISLDTLDTVLSFCPGIAFDQSINRFTVCTYGDLESETVGNPALP